MNSKERMMTAIKKGKPDRLPVTIHSWRKYHLDHYMGGVTDIEANKMCGLDAAITVSKYIDKEYANWKVTFKDKAEDGNIIRENFIETPEGNLCFKQGINEMTTWVIEPLIKREEDIYLLKKYRPVPVIDREAVIKAYDTLGDGGIIRTFLCGHQGGCWQDACELFGTEKLIMQCFDDPDWVHELLQILVEWKLKYIERNLINLPIDLVETGGGASSCTVISPSIHEEFCLPYDIKLHDALHNAGYPVVYHTCGGMTKISHLIVKNHCDVSETLSPIGVGGDIADNDSAKKLYEDLFPNVALIGGMDQFNVLERGTKEMIEKEVERLFNIFGKNGGYIMSACDHFFHVRPENLIAYARAAENFKY